MPDQNTSAHPTAARHIPAGPDPARRGRLAVSAMFAVNGFLMGSYALQIPLLLPRHAITESTLGLMILMLGVGAVGAMAFSGPVLHAIGSRWSVLLFALLAAPAFLGIALAPVAWQSMVAMVGLGAFAGCMDVAMNANAVEVERRLDRAIMSSAHGFWSLGGFAGSLAGGFLIEGVGAAAHAWIATATALALVLAAAPFLIAEPVQARQANDGTAPEGSSSHWPRAPLIYILGAIALFSMIPEGAVMDWAALYLSRTFAADVSTSGLAFACMSATMAVMRFLGDGVRNRFGAVPTLRVSALIAFAGMFMAAVAPVGWIAIAGFAVAGIGVSNLVPIAFSAAGNQPGVRSGTGIAIVTMMGYSGILFAPSGIGFAAEYTGYRLTFLALSLLLLAVASQAWRVASADRVARVPASGAPGGPHRQKGQTLPVAANPGE